VALYGLCNYAHDSRLSDQDGLVVVLHSFLSLLFLLIVMMLPVVAVEHWMWALVVAFEVARRACLMASMNFQKQWALRLRHLCCALGVLVIPLVDPIRFEFGTLVVTFRAGIAGLACGTPCMILAHCVWHASRDTGTFVDFALRVALVDRWEILARLHHRCPWLRALGMTLDILAALLVASTSFLHHLHEPELMSVLTMVGPVSMLSMMGPMSVLIMMGPLAVPALMEL